MARGVRVVLGGLVLAVSVVAAVGYLNADFTIERDVAYGPGGALINPAPDFERRATLLRCSSEGAGRVNETGDPVFTSGDEPVPLLEPDICDAPRRAVAALPSVLRGGAVASARGRLRAAETLRALRRVAVSQTLRSGQDLPAPWREVAHRRGSFVAPAPAEKLARISHRHLLREAQVGCWLR